MYEHGELHLLKKFLNFCIRVGILEVFERSWGMRRTRRLEISLKLFLDQKDRLLNNLERLEHLRSLSVAIKK